MRQGAKRGELAARFSHATASEKPATAALLRIAHVRGVAVVLPVFEGLLAWLWWNKSREYLISHVGRRREEKQSGGKACHVCFCQCSFHCPPPAMEIAGLRRPCRDLRIVVGSVIFVMWCVVKQGTHKGPRPASPISEEQHAFFLPCSPSTPPPYTQHRIRTQGLQGGSARAARRLSPLFQPWPPSKVRPLAHPFFSPCGIIIIIMSPLAGQTKMVEGSRGRARSSQSHLCVRHDHLACVWRWSVVVASWTTPLPFPSVYPTLPLTSPPLLLPLPSLPQR